MRRFAFNVIDRCYESIRQPDSAALQTNDDNAFKSPIAFNDLMSNTSNRSIHIGLTEYRDSLS